MASYWDFRHILGLNPEEDFTCVGTTQRARKRCTNRLHVNDRSTAGRLLNQMNQTKDFYNSTRDLEQLAELMLCKHFHNSDKNPHLSQVDDMRAQWTSRIKQEYLSIKKVKEEAAMMKTRRELIRMRKHAMVVKSEQESDNMERRERVCRHT